MKDTTQTPIDWDAVHAELESQGKFDEYTTPYNFDHTVPVDKDYVYLKKNPGYKAYAFFARVILFLFGPLVNYVAFGLKVRGRKNLRTIRKTGAFSISNHVHYLDNLVLRQGIRARKVMYFTVAPHNCKSGIAGLTMRAGGILPLPSNEHLSAMRNMHQAYEKILSKKRLIHFYAERAMWMYYPKPRPFKRGAFYYAVKFDVPVLPMFLTFAPARGIRKLFGAKHQATLHIMPALRPDASLPPKARILDLQERVQETFIRQYRSVYGVDRPIIYDIDPSYYDKLDEDTLLACKVSAKTVGATFDPHAAASQTADTVTTQHDAPASPADTQ